MRILPLLLACVLAIPCCAGEAARDVIDLPDGKPGIGFDDLQYSRSLHAVLVPGGRSGHLVLVDPKTRAVTAISGFSSTASWGGGHDEGVTSVDVAGPLLLATDRTTQELDVVDPSAKAIVARAKLASGPDYVRFVGSRNEAWVTEPDSDRIEIFTLDGAKAPVHAAFLDVEGGPESLVVDDAGGRAYTHLWEGRTVALDLSKRAIVATWTNGCRGSRGIALDAAYGVLLCGCSEGRVTALDAKSGALISSVEVGAGVDIIAWSPETRRVFAPGARTDAMAVVSVSEAGALTLEARVPGAKGSHCATVDEKGVAYACDPAEGRLLVTSRWPIDCLPSVRSEPK